MKRQGHETYLNQMSQSMLIPGHHLCDVKSDCHKGGAGREKGLGMSLEQESKKQSMSE